MEEADEAPESARVREEEYYNPPQYLPKHKLNYHKERSNES